MLTGGTSIRHQRKLASLWFLALVASASAFAAGATLAVEKSPIVLGQTESVAVTISVTEPAGEALRPLRLAVNVGSFSPVQRTAQGKYRAVYTPPGTRFPQVALVAVWRESGADAVIEFLRIPLFGSTRLPIGAKRKSKVTVMVADQSFGPALVDDGNIELPITVPPGVLEAELRVREPNGNTLTKRLPIDVPAYNRVTVGLVPHAIVADGKERARLDVFYDKAEAGMKESRLKVTASLGTVTFDHAEAGRFVYWYRPPADTGAPAVEFNVSVDGDARAKASARLILGLTPAARVVLRPPGKPMRADGTSKDKVEVVVLDNEGLGLPDQKIDLTANGVAMKGLSYQGNGVYRTDFTAPNAFPAGGLIQFVATTPSTDGTPLQGVANYLMSATGLPRQATWRLTPAPIPADGHTSAELHLDVRDEAGLPLAGAKLVAIASHGTLGPVEEEGEGRYHAAYVPPQNIPDGETLIRVVDSTGLFEQRIEVPMREDVRRFLIGVRGGFVHSLGDLMGPRGGVDLSIPVRAGGVLLWFSVVAQVGAASQTVTDGSGALSTQSELVFFPFSGRLAVELYAGRRLALQLGAGGGATYARYSTSLTGERSVAWGPHALGFVGLTLAVGPGHFFLEAGYTWAPVNAPAFRVETGGIGGAAGYRLGIF